MSLELYPFVEDDDPEPNPKYNNVLGMMSQDYLAELANISVHSVIEYIKELEKLELIYVSRCSLKFKEQSS